MVTALLGSLPGSAQPVPRVFILHSYEANHVCGQPQQDGISAALKEAGFPCGQESGT